MSGFEIKRSIKSTGQHIEWLAFPRSKRYKILIDTSRILSNLRKTWFRVWLLLLFLEDDDDDESVALILLLFDILLVLDSSHIWYSMNKVSIFLNVFIKIFFSGYKDSNKLWRLCSEPLNIKSYKEPDTVNSLN